ncbi:PaaI family thioesterase [bacterium]|nr:PaaI family thioesterase [bacterium]
MTTRRIALFKEGIDLELLSSGGGASEVSLQVKPSHMNAVGVLHGGAVFTLVDSGMACAIMELLRQGETCVSIEIKVQNVAPVREGTLVASSVVLHKGRTIAHVESEVRTAQGRLVAKGMGTFFVRTPVTARGEPRGS